MEETDKQSDKEVCEASTECSGGRRLIPSSDQDLKHEEFYQKVREASQAERTACTKKGGGRGHGGRGGVFKKAFGVLQALSSF